MSDMVDVGNAVVRCADKKLAQRAAKYYTYVHYFCTFFASRRNALRGANLAHENAGFADYAATCRHAIAGPGKR
jgi:hypothetical protein